VSLDERVARIETMRSERQPYKTVKTIKALGGRSVINHTETDPEGTGPGLVWCSEPLGSTILGGRLESARHFF
jgi:hypothetical protein